MHAAAEEDACCRSASLNGILKISLVNYHVTHWTNPHHNLRVRYHYFHFTSEVTGTNIHWEDWSWSWSSNILATWSKELTHWKRLWCWERLRARGEGGDRGWDDWMASLTCWTWVWTWLWEMVKGREAWCAAVHRVTKSQTQPSNWTTREVWWAEK